MPNKEPTATSNKTKLIVSTQDLYSDSVQEYFKNIGLTLSFEGIE